MEEGYNGEFAQKLIEAVETFAALDRACDKVKGTQICDAVGVKCDLSCKVYVKKDRLLKFRIASALQDRLHGDFFIGVDLGKKQDHSVVAVIRRLPCCLTAGRKDLARYDTTSKRSFLPPLPNIVMSSIER